MKNIRFEIKDELDQEIAKAIVDGLDAFNNSQVEESLQRDLMVAARDPEGRIIGGIKAHTHRGWLYVGHLWIAEAHRSEGLGSSLMELAEKKARQRDCFAAYLYTYSFQASDFYQKLGYQIFGELKDFPRGHRRIYLQKSLSA